MERPSYVELVRIIEQLEPGGTLLRSWSYTGGLSAQVTGVEVERFSGGRVTYVIRGYGDADVKGRPHVARDELMLLRFLLSQGLPVPTPRGYDETKTILPRPYLVIGHINGETDDPLSDLNAAMREAASFLARLHSLDWQHPKWKGTLVDVLPPLATRPGLPQPPSPPNPNPPCILHGDFWPGNILWRNDRLVGVIDWEDSALGDPLSDLANARLEMLWAYDEQGMDAFTSHYRSLMPHLDYEVLPYWDIWASQRLPISEVVTWGLSEFKVETMIDYHAEFVAAALKRILPS